MKVHCRDFGSSTFVKETAVFKDGLAHVVVMKTFRGWHCPHCSYISPSQKGNLKVHILNRELQIQQQEERT